MIDGNLTDQLRFNYSLVNQAVTTNVVQRIPAARLEKFVEDYAAHRWQHVPSGRVPIYLYSGGLESSVTALGNHGFAHFIHVVDAERLCRSLHLEVMECALAYAVAHVFGSSLVFIGAEYTPLSRRAEFTSTYMHALYWDLELSLLAPLQWIDKFSIFRQAHTLGLRFNSCSNGGDCGECFKCLQIETFLRALGGARLSISHTLVDRVRKEFYDFERTGVDQFFDDCYSFQAMQHHTGRHFNDIWK